MGRRAPVFVLLLLVPLGAEPVPTAPPGTGRLAGARAADSLVASWVARERIPGAVLLVQEGDSVLIRRAYGYARLYDYGAGQYPDAFRPDAPRSTLRRLNRPVPMETTTVFDLASVTKVVGTTMALMLLVDRGEVALDDPLIRFLPEFGEGSPERSRVTLRHLLAHRSGLPQWLPIYYDAATPEAALHHVATVPLRWPVGVERHYSDLGFMLLGAVVERVSGRPLDRFLDEELYRPMGLTRTGFRRAGRVASAPPPGEVAATSHGNPFERRMVYDPDFGYRIDGDPTRWDGWRRRTLVGEVNDGNAWHAFGGVAGHAGLFSTADELAQLVRLLLDGGAWRGGRLLSRETVRSFLMVPEAAGAAAAGLTTSPPTQLLGWQRPAYAPRGSFGHTGFTGTFVLGVPSRDLAVVLLTNRQNVGLGPDHRYVDVAPLQKAVVTTLLEGQ